MPHVIPMGFVATTLAVPLHGYARGADVPLAASPAPYAASVLAISTAPPGTGWLPGMRVHDALALRVVEFFAAGAGLWRLARA